MSFRWKLLSAYFLTLFAILVLSYFWTHEWLQNFYRDTVRADLENQVLILARAIDPSQPGLDQFVDSLSRDSSYRLTILDRSGHVVADSSFSGTELNRMEGHDDRPEIRQAYEASVGTSVRYSVNTEEYRLYVATQFPDGQHLLRLSVPLTDIAGSAWSLKRELLWRALVILLIGAGATWLIVRGATSSITNLIAAAQRISNGQFLSFIPVTSRDELGLLARRMEAMSMQLKQQVEAVASERDHLTTILNSMREGVLVVDEDGLVTISNPAFRQTFESAGDPIGKTPLEVVRSHQLREGIAQVLDHRREINLEVRRGGKTLLARFTPFGDHSRPGGTVVVFHDITELRRLENIRKDFVSNVSHELKTPLTSIRGYAETLLDEENLESVHRKFIEKIYRNADQLAGIIEQLFALAHLESGKQALPHGPVHFESLMMDLKKEFAAVLAEKNLEFHFQNLSTKLYFPASETYIRHVFHNLLENSIKYTESGSIAIKMEESDGQLLFSIQDTGIGIPTPELGRIFERFYRVDKDRSRISGGSGIGLAIVKHIVQLHGGRVWAESEPGRGTTVFFTLPDEDIPAESSDRIRRS